MPVDPGGAMPRSIVYNEQLAHAFLFRNGFSHLVQENLKDIRINAIDNQTEQRAALRSDRTDYVLANVIAQIRHGASFSRLNPTPSRPGIPLDTAFITEPQFHCRIG